MKKAFNASHPDDTPFDIGADLITIAQAKEFITAFDAGDYAECQKISAKMCDVHVDMPSWIVEE